MLSWESIVIESVGGGPVSIRETWFSLKTYLSDMQNCGMFSMLLFGYQ